MDNIKIVRRADGHYRILVGRIAVGMIYRDQYHIYKKAAGLDKNIKVGGTDE